MAQAYGALRRLEREGGSEVKTPCAIPFCHGGIGTNESGEEALCERHWRMSKGPLRRRYEAAWEECTRNDRAGVLDEDACKRASDAWHELVAYVVRMVV